MIKLSSTRLVVAVGGLALLLITGAGAASAEPDISPVIHTTCNYSQAVAALNAEAPQLAKELSAYPDTQSSMRKFLASPVDQRQQMVQQWQSTRVAQQYAGQLLNIANICDKY
jgi:hemophore-related protein